MKKAILLSILVLTLLWSKPSQAILVSGWATADDEFWVWNYQENGSWGGSYWYKATSSLTQPWYGQGNNCELGYPDYIYIAAKNSGGNYAGFIADIRASGGYIFEQTGNDVILTDTTHWKVLAWQNGWADNPLVNPTTLTGWTAPTSYGTNDFTSNPWDYVNNIDNKAHWIWTDNNSGPGIDDYVFIHMPFTLAVPEPASMLLLGFGLLGASLLKRRKT